jgi:hypothetical protein
LNSGSGIVVEYDLPRAETIHVSSFSVWNDSIEGKAAFCGGTTRRARYMGSFLKKASFGLALPFALLSLMSAQTPTTTTLAISPYNSVALDTVVTLTATVTNPGAVTAGTVNFCNVNSTDCSPGSGLYGTAQLTSAGTATIKHVFGYGVNNIKAVFLRTTANASSTSLTPSASLGVRSIQAPQLWEQQGALVITLSAGQ